MKELRYLRKRNEKHFLNDDGTISLYLYNNDIHYLKNGEYVDIDNTLEEKEEIITNKENSFHTSFPKDKNTNLLVDITKENYYLKIYLIKSKNNKIKINRNKNTINLENILEDIDIDYQVISTTLKESIILKNKNNIPNTLSFKIDTNLELELLEKGSIQAKDKEKTIFVIDKPFMKDNKGVYNYNINYDLSLKDNTYLLNLNLDQVWLNEAEFPVIIDPTISNIQNNGIAADAYIYSWDDVNYTYNKEMLKVGLEQEQSSNIYETLIKFNLPNIGTGFDIIDAHAYLISHASDTSSNDNNNYIYVYEMEKDWDENTVSFMNLSSSHSNHVEDFFIPTRSKIEGDTIYLQTSSFNITSLMKKWYSGHPNYGIILKTNELPANCKEYIFYSKDNTVMETTNPTPYLVITYRNQNGLEDYMTYQTQEYTDGASYINNLTGNLTTTFDLNETIGGKYPISLSLIYNTNDVVLNTDYGYKVGYKLNLHETIKEVTIDQINYLEYIDADSTIHYFRGELNDEGETIENKYIDEDGLGLSATKETNQITINDMDNNKYIFTLNNNIYYLTKLINTNEDEVTITYDTNNRINKITDANNSSINITYNENSMIITSDSKTTTINYSNNKISSIITKNGTTSFTYNSNGLVERITDVNGLSKGFTYYEVSPYKVKKITEYGLANEEGASLEFIYNFMSTKVIDNKEKQLIYSFNLRGNTIGVSNLTDEINLISAYGRGATFITNEEIENSEKVNKNINKIESNILSTKYTKNLIENSSFEETGGMGRSTFYTGRTDEYARTGSYSLDLTQSSIVTYVDKDNIYYTFSGYFKNNEEISIVASSEAYATGPCYLYFGTIPKNEEFTRYSFSFLLPENKSLIMIDFNIANNGSAYLDDMQLEEGKIANYYNFVENGDFSNGINGWNIDANTNYNVIDIGDSKALQIIFNQDKISDFSKSISLHGKKDDIYCLSFWYKNNGIIPSISDNTVDINHFLNFEYTNGITNVEEEIDTLNYYDNTWNYFSKTYKAKEAFDEITLNFKFIKSLGELLITNIMLTNGISFEKNSYESARGVLKVKEEADGSNTTFTYDENNQLISMFNPLGNNFKFEYDNIIIDRVLKGVSPSGISNEIEYDEFGNPIKTMINNVNPDQDVLNNKNYYIRLKGTKKYLDCNFLTKEINLKEDSCSHDVFTLIKEGDYYRIKINNEYITLVNNNIQLTKQVSEESLFNLSLNDNNSYLITPKTKYITTSEEGGTVIDLVNYNLASINDKLSLKTSNTTESEEQFFFEDIDTQAFIESKAEYTLDGKFITKTIDSLGNITTYDINTTNGLTNSITDPNNITTYYTYNDKDQITKVKKEEKEVNYTYNTNNLLSKITANNKEYNFTYDNFLNAKQIKIGDNITLITNNYENDNGNLLSSVYGNGDTISYTYDELDRIKTVTNDTNTYTYHYSNVGNLAKITGFLTLHTYNYDSKNQVIEYSQGDGVTDDKYFIRYNYDKNGNIINKRYKLNHLPDTITQKTTFEYNSDDAIIKVTFDNNNLNYSYDYLGRLINKDINGNNKVEYTYITNGNKTSTVLKSMKINNDLYEYIYDNLYNITDIYLNNKLINHYEYDNFNELIKEDNYNLNKTIRYTYDNAGNILKKQEYELDTYNLLHTDTYEYNNANWEDQLTKYNNESITYDEIGNPISIGNKTLTWNNGRQLSSYTDNDLNITYGYNINGIRTQKKVNNTITNYFTENNKIIFEQTGNNMIYYIRDEEGSLIGFKYNNTTYYYIKNIQEDIIGLTDSSYNLVCSYEYDSWGKLISIKDSNNNVITNTSHIGYINPFRYRSYYYDNETKLYYLNSRYYNSEWGRFVNADGIINGNLDFISYNLNVYVSNNPVFAQDNGMFISFKTAAEWGKMMLQGATAGVSYFIGAVGDLNISSSMLNKSMYNPNKEISKKTKSNLRTKIQNSKEMQKAIDSCLKDNRNCVGSTAFISNKDLKNSVGSADYIIEKKYNYVTDTRYLKITISDVYDFDEWRKGLSFGNMANNMGYLYQKNGLLSPYQWDITYFHFY